MTFAVTLPSIQDANAIVPNGHGIISLDFVIGVVVVVKESKSKCKLGHLSLVDYINCITLFLGNNFSF